MATSSFLENQKQTSDRTEDASKPSSYHPFSWMNKWIIYCPTWTHTTIQNHKVVKRNPWVRKIGFPLIILICIFFWIWEIVFKIHYQGVSLYTVVYSVAISLLNISRLLTIYYFFNHFQFYGVHETTADKNDIEMKPSALSLPQYQQTTKRISVRMKVILFWVICGLTIIHISNAIQLVNDSDKQKNSGMIIFQICYSFLSIYFYEVPLFLAQFVLSLFYCEGCIFIKDFAEVIDKSINVDFQSAINEYTAFRREFKKKIRLLEIMMMFRLTAAIAWVWFDTAGIVRSETWVNTIDESLWLINDFLPFFEIVMAGNAATRQYHKFKRQLYAIGTRTDFLTDSSIHQTQYLFLLDYVSAFPFLIKIFAKEVSFRNGLKVTAAFVAAKVIAYLWQHNL